MKAYNIIVSGKVQGVWFRRFTQLKAQELSVKGFVKNLLDGSVYIEAEGTESAVQQLIAWCHNGPDAAVVTNVQADECSAKNYADFAIQY